MSNEKEITADDLNKAMQKVVDKARRENKALGIDTLCQIGDYLIRIDPDGNRHKVKKLRSSRTDHSTSKAVTFS